MTRPAAAQFESIPWLFPLVYLTLAQSTTALMIVVGLLGQPILAADIALAHGATVATFHALSANTRNLLLGQSKAVTLADILRMRLALVVPLAVAAYLLAVSGTAVAAWLALCLVLRRCSEWFNDLVLCKAEVEHRTRPALAFLGVQTVLFLGAALALLLGWQYAPIALGAWALVPLAFTLPLRRELHRGPLAGTLRRLLPHAGATAIGGLALYAFRLIVVLLLAKSLAGELFTAIAIGSFIGTLFASVVGPSVELHRQRTGQGLPRSLRIVLGSALVIGLVMTISAAGMQPDVRVLGKTGFFWLACGLSLIGGVVMVGAGMVRLRILRADDGRDLFGPEILLHIGLLISAPLAVRVAGPSGAAALYLINAVVAYVFYKSSELAQARVATGAGPWLERLRFATAFMLVFPLFFQLSGHIYNSKDPMIDSGGALFNVPLPVSLLACLGGIVLLADYRRATRSFAFVFLLFTAMLLSVLVTTPAGEPFDRAKLLLLMQVLLPAFGLALGEMLETDRARTASAIERAFFWACAVIMPAQLIATWIQGEASLTHWLGLFSVYQHRQYVPVVLASAAIVAVAGLRNHPRYGPWTVPLLVTSVLYALATYSMLAMFLSFVGLVVLGSGYLRGLGPRTGLAGAGVIVLAICAQIFLLRDTSDWRVNSKLVTYEKLSTRYMASCTKERLGYVSSVLVDDGRVCTVRRTGSEGTRHVLVLMRRAVGEGDTLVVEGELRSGSIQIVLRTTDDSEVVERRIDESGPFRVELPATEGLLDAVILSGAPRALQDDWSISRVAWRLARSAEAPRAVLRAPEVLEHYLPLNALERVGDWILFGRPIFTSLETFLAGHPKPMDRAVRSSPHNYYIDLTYNFGTLTLLPVIGLIVYTLRLAWQRRRDIWRSDRLAGITVLVLFLVLVDSNFKVTLRQPYPGIFAFFLWGLLLARLRTWNDPTAPPRGRARKPARPAPVPQAAP